MRPKGLIAMEFRDTLQMLADLSEERATIELDRAGLIRMALNTCDFSSVESVLGLLEFTQKSDVYDRCELNNATGYEISAKLRRLVLELTQ